MKLSQNLKDQLWWLVISVDYDYSRISIADHELSSDSLMLWLEDKHDFKNTLDECVLLEVNCRQFAKIIRSEQLNTYEGVKQHPKKHYTYKTRIEVNEAIKWYQEDASAIEQAWAREAVLKRVLTHLVESEVCDSRP